MCWLVYPLVKGKVSSIKPGSLSAQGQKSMMLVICTSLSIMKEQVQFLKAKGIPAAYAGQSEDIDDWIATCDFSLVFDTPETCWSSQVETPSTDTIVVGKAGRSGC